MSVNDITGDRIVTEPASEKYRNNWDAIFGKNGEAAPDTSNWPVDLTDKPAVKTCIKCPRNIEKYCDYCGIRQCDGDVASWSLSRVRLK